VLRTLVDGGSFFEAPRWHDGRWWVSDFYRRTVFAIGAGGRAEAVMEVEGMPSGLGWMPDGSLLAVSMSDHRILRRRPDGALSVHADLSEHCGGLLNDLVVDRHGRAYAGNFGFDLIAGEPARPTVLMRVEPGGTATVAATGLRFPNGALITPDGRTLIVAETFGGRLSAWTIAGDGSLHDHRVWARPAKPFSPDGCTLDAEGHVWVADAVGGRAARVAPGGPIVDEVRVPEGLQVFACQLGGDDGRTLLLCAAPDFDAHARRDAREAVLLTTTVRVPHAGWP
jgi:sugar lactone lactonase YvrE